jgi:hypothetical protein
MVDVKDAVPVRDGTSEQIRALHESNAMLVKVENDTMQSLAVARPRDLVSIRKNVESELEVFPEIAETAWYSIPYKDKKNNRTVYVEGPSVHTARRLAQAWGNLTVDCRIVELTNDSCVVQGVAIDMQTNYRYNAPPLRVSRFTRQYGKFVQLDDDRWNLKIASAMAKALRNALFGVVPEGFVMAYVSKAKEIASALQDGKKRGPGRPKKADKKARILAAFNDWPEIGESHLLILTGLDNLENITKDQAEKLHGVRNALKDGSITVDGVLKSVAEVDAGGEESPDDDSASITDDE